MPAVPERIVITLARAGSFLAVALGLWYGCAAMRIPFAGFVVIYIGVAATLFAVSRRHGRQEERHDGLPLLPLIIVLVVVFSPLTLAFHAALGSEPHWFRSADEAFMILGARGLEHGFPPADLSYAGEPLRYHLGASLLDDLLRRVTGLPVHTIHYAVAPVVMRIIVVAALLLLAGRIAPGIPVRWRVWMPLAAGAVPTIDLFSVIWHLHDFGVRGKAAFASFDSLPIFGLWLGVLNAVSMESSVLAIAFVLVLAATWRETTFVEKAALLFAIFLAKAQVFLAVEVGYAVVALIELVRRQWRAAAGGALALACVAVALEAGSTYGSSARLIAGWGALCRSLLSRHGLEHRFPAGVVLAVEAVVIVGAIHVLALAVLYALRRMRRPLPSELILGLSIAGGGVLVPAILRLAPSDELRLRFTGVHAGVSDRLFAPLPEYLDRILDVSVNAAFDAFTLMLPVVGLPLLVAWMYGARSPFIRKLLAITAVGLLVAGALGSSVLAIRPGRMPKEVAPDARIVLRAIPAEARAVLTNDLAWDDRAERHLPLLNIWAPAVSGRQFWASAFMFTFQHPDAAERLRIVNHFFAPSTSPATRLAIARAQGIDFVFLRRDLAPAWSSEGWSPVAKSGRYELYELAARGP